MHFWFARRANQKCMIDQDLHDRPQLHDHGPEPPRRITRRGERGRPHTVEIMPTLPYANPGTPPLGSAWPYLLWVARGQWRSLSLGAALGVTWVLAQALLPWALGRAVDSLSRPGAGTIAGWCAVLI